MSTLVYTDVGSAPLDAYTTPDLGDAGTDGDPLLRVPLNAGTVSPPYLIPYTRPLAQGDQGRDVVGAKRAIWRANGLRVSDAFTRTFGPIADTQLRRFQKAHGLTADGVLGVNTLKKLAPSFDAYAFLLYVGYPPGSTVRARIVAYVLWGYNNRGAIGYSQYRPMTYLNDLQHIPINEDCSTFVTKAYEYAGAPDPNGLRYDGYGNTGTMRQHGTLISLALALPGDLVHYDAPQHVGVYVGHGRVVELGSPPGPLLMSATYRRVAQVRRYF